MLEKRGKHVSDKFYTLYLRQGYCYMLKTSVLSGKGRSGSHLPPFRTAATNNGTLRRGVTPSSREGRGAGPPALCHSPSLALGSFPPPPPSQPPPTRNPKRVNSTGAPNAARHRFPPRLTTQPQARGTQQRPSPPLSPRTCALVSLPPPRPPLQPGGVRPGPAAPARLRDGAFLRGRTPRVKVAVTPGPRTLTVPPSLPRHS